MRQHDTRNGRYHSGTKLPGHREGGQGKGEDRLVTTAKQVIANATRPDISTWGTRREF